MIRCLPRRLLRTLLASIAVLALAWPGGATAAAAPEDEPEATEPPGPLATSWEAWRIVEEHFLDRSKTESARLVVGATTGLAEGALEPKAAEDPRLLAHRMIRGMVRALGDPNTVFLTPEERTVTITGYAGNLEGIGTCLELREGRPTVSGMVLGGPADEAGLRRGDVVVAVDGRPTEGLPLREVVLGLRGASGSRVRVTTTSGELTVERAEVRLRSARGVLAEPGIGLLRLVAFTDGTDEEAGAALEELARDGARGLVVDLRGNLGGLLRPAVAVASRFTPVDPVAWQENGHGERYAYERPAERGAIDWPVVALVDNWTASAAEVLALVLRDSGRATIVGRTTYGKGTIQYLFELRDGSGLHITAARWLGPSGTPLDPGGLQPDVWSFSTASESADPGLEEALRLLRPLVGTGRAASGTPVRIPADDCSPNDANAA